MNGEAARGELALGWTGSGVGVGSGANRAEEKGYQREIHDMGYSSVLVLPCRRCGPGTRDSNGYEKPGKGTARTNANELLTLARPENETNVLTADLRPN